MGAAVLVCLPSGGGEVGMGYKGSHIPVKTKPES